MADINECPDCGELLAFHRGVVPLTATAYCPSCLYCDVMDEDRQDSPQEDYLVRNSNQFKTTLEYHDEEEITYTSNLYY